MRVSDYLRVLEAATTTPGERELAAKALLEELASGAELSAAQEAALEARYQAEADVGVAALLSRALTRLATRRHVDRDPSARFDPRLERAERETLTALVTRVSLLIDEAQGAGEFHRRYTIEGEREPGGMGRIILGRRRADRVPVVIKVILDDRAGDAAFRARFRREARVLERLRHPHVVELFEWGEVGGRIYLVMECVAGGDVAGWLESGSIPPDARKAILLQTLEALGACHDAGVIHRDVKPGNLLVASREAPVTVKLADFGLAKDLRLTDGLTHAGMVMGSIPYAAPEQREDPGSVTAAADLHAFGVTAYEVLSGGGLPVGNYPPLSEIDRAYPQELDGIIAACLARRPADRPVSVHELRRALQAILP